MGIEQIALRFEAIVKFINISYQFVVLMSGYVIKKIGSIIGYLPGLLVKSFEIPVQPKKIVGRNLVESNNFLVNFSK
jgi:hypothetical protein